MKSLSILSLALTISLATSANAVGFFSGSQTSLADSVPVPGDSPLKYCEDPSKNILEIDHVNLDPNPPQEGEELTIEAVGTLTDDVKQGSKAFLEVKYGPIKLINQEVDLCEQVQNVDQSCPLKKGDLTFSRTLKMPKPIPHGKYYVKADVYTEDQDTITCLEAEVDFS